MKTVLITFGGREVSLRILFNYIVKYKKYFDEYHIYVATKNQNDIKFMETFANQNDFVKIIYTRKEGVIVSDVEYVWDNAYNNCQNSDTVYIKLDDDIVYLDENLFTKFVPFRIEHKEIPIVYPVIINNCIISGKLEEKGIINYNKKTNLMRNWKDVYAPFHNMIKNNPGMVPRLQDLVGEKNLLCPVAWRDYGYCINLHNDFIKSYHENTIHKYKMENFVLENCEPASIACISWLGSSLKNYIEKFGPVKRDEQWWSVYVPTWTGQRNVVFGDCIVSHYAYYVQREQGLDNTDILQRYYEISLQQ